MPFIKIFYPEQYFSHEKHLIKVQELIAEDIIRIHEMELTDISQFSTHLIKTHTSSNSIIAEVLVDKKHHRTPAVLNEVARSIVNNIKRYIHDEDILIEAFVVTFNHSISGFAKNQKTD